MRVLLVVDQLQHPAARADLHLLATGLEPKRIQPLVVAIRGDGAALGDLCDVSLGCRSRLEPRIVPTLVRLVRQYDIELIHALEPGIAPHSACVGQLTDIPMMATCYEVRWMPDNHWPRRLMQRTGWSAFFRVIDRLIVPSELVKRNLLYITEAARERIEVVYSGVALPEGCPPPDPASARAQLGLPDGPLVAMILPPERDEGYDAVFDVLHRLLKKLPGLHMVIGGRGPTLTELQRKAASIRPALPIRWFTDPESPWTMIFLSDVVLDCAAHERLPQGLVMAALAGKPIVAPRLPGITEIIEGNVSGLLVTPGDVTDMALQVLRLLQYEGLAHRVSRIARRRGMERFSIDAQRRTMTALYESTIYGRR